MSLIGYVFLLFLSLPLYSCLTSTIPEDSFENIKNNNLEQLVVFYRSSEPQAEQVLRIIEKTVPRIRAIIPHFTFARCDGDKPENVAAFKEAQFNTGVFIFTSTPIEGIVKYTLPVTVKDIVQYVNFKYLPFNESDIVQFTNEDDFFDRMDLSETPRPIFVKFYETWCQHCKRLAPTFQRGATFFKERVDFLEVECSKNTETQAFCSRNDVHAFPVLMLFTGEEKIKYEDENRNIASFQSFFKKHIEGYKLVKHKKGKKQAGLEDGDEQVVPAKKVEVSEAPTTTTTPAPAASTSTPTPTATPSSDDTPKKKKSKKKKKQEEEEEEEEEEDEEAAAAARAARRKAKREKAAAEAEAKKKARRQQVEVEEVVVKTEETPIKTDKQAKKKKGKREKKKEKKEKKTTQAKPDPVEELDLSSVGEFSLPSDRSVDDLDLSSVGEFSLPPEDETVPTSTPTPTSTSTSDTTTSKDTAARLDALEASVRELKFMLQQQQALLQQLTSRT